MRWKKCWSWHGHTPTWWAAPSSGQAYVSNLVNSSLVWSLDRTLYVLERPDFVRRTTRVNRPSLAIPGDKNLRTGLVARTPVLSDIVLRLSRYHVFILFISWPVVFFQGEPTYSETSQRHTSTYSHIDFALFCFALVFSDSCRCCTSIDTESNWSKTRAILMILDWFYWARLGRYWRLPLLLGSLRIKSGCTPLNHPGTVILTDWIV